MIRRFIVNVRGKRHEWGFVVYGTDADAADWRADGLDVIEPINSVPAWLPTPLIPLWCRLQDIWNLPSTWGRK